MVAGLQGTVPAALADVAWPTALTAHADALTAHWQRAIAGNLQGETILRLGALLHDIGKATTRTVEADGRIRFLGHAGVGAEMAAVAAIAGHFVDIRKWSEVVK